MSAIGGWFLLSASSPSRDPLIPTDPQIGSTVDSVSLIPDGQWSTFFLLTCQKRGFRRFHLIILPESFAAVTKTLTSHTQIIITHSNRLFSQHHCFQHLSNAYHIVGAQSIFDKLIAPDAQIAFVICMCFSFRRLRTRCPDIVNFSSLNHQRCIHFLTI